MKLTITLFLLFSWQICTYLSFPWICGLKNTEQPLTILLWSLFPRDLLGNCVCCHKIARLLKKCPFVEARLSFVLYLNLYLKLSDAFRVQPYISLNYLRDHIEEQLGPEVVPEDYVFLRSVGRCMAVVSTKAYMNETTGSVVSFILLRLK